jgi:tRNA(Ile)-lysidine synthase
MEIELERGKYIIAVSGGVDSMVLLDLAAKLENAELIVAHFDHGIHERSAEYCDFVKAVAKTMGLKFVSEKGELGPSTSEAKAREARYKFLNKAKDEYKAKAILTAHHRDDLLETAVINLLRGSGRKGLSSLRSTQEIKRPLLPYTKKQITNYAKKQELTWREDPTNQDTSYMRNYVRLKIVPRLNEKQKKQFLGLIDSQQETNRVLEKLIAKLSQKAVVKDENSVLIAKNLQLEKKIFNGLSHDMSKELMAELLRSEKIPFDAKLLEKSVVFAKTARPGKKFVLSKRYYFEVAGDKVILNLL